MRGRITNVLSTFACGAVLGGVANLLVLPDVAEVPLPSMQSSASEVEGPAAASRARDAYAVMAPPPDRTAAGSGARPERVRSVALRVELVDSFFGRPADSSFVAVVEAGGEPPRTGLDLGRGARQLRRESDGSFTLGRLAAGRWLVLAGRARSGALVTQIIDKMEAPARVRLELPADLGPDFVELRVNGPDGATPRGVTAMTVRMSPIALVQGSVGGVLRYWFASKDVQFDNPAFRRLVLTAPGLGTICPACDPNEPLVVASFARPGEVLVRTTGLPGSEVLVELRADVPTSPEGFTRSPSLDACPTVVGKSVRFSNLQPGAYRVLVRRPMPDDPTERFYTRYERPLAQATVKVRGREALDIAVPSSHDLLVKLPEEGSEFELRDVVSSGGSSRPSLRNPTRVTRTFAVFEGLPAGSFNVRSAAGSDDGFTINVPLGRPFVEIKR